MKRLLLLTVCCGTICAADLGQEAARWGPVSPRQNPYPAEVPPWWMSWYGLWCGDALVWSEPSHRLAGLERVQRTTAPIDGQVSVSFLHAGAANIFVPSYDDTLYLRPYLRAGTDAQAPHGTYLVSAGTVVGWGFLGSCAAEVGRSGERRQVLSGEADLFILHLRGEIDDQRQTGRIGITWRFPGGIDGIAVGVTIDEAHTTVRRIRSGRSSAQGLIGEVTAQWLVDTHLHLDAGISGATETITETGVLSHGQLSGDLGIGVGF